MPSRTHGATSLKPGNDARRSLFRLWSNIKNRCRNPNTARYKDYGGRGITICDEWLDFDAFAAGVGMRPTGMSLDRIDNSRGYEPGNVRWASPTTQNRNSRRAVMVSYAGKTQCIAAWCEELGLKYVTVKARRKRGWSLVDAVTTPPDSKHRSR
jgi:hypothetical protein